LGYLVCFEVVTGPTVFLLLNCVIVTKLILAQNAVHGFATLAAENFLLVPDAGARAIAATMVAACG
jgi:hypothetical protein